MRILAFADIYAKPGRKAVAAALPGLKSRYQPDILLCNVENLAGGRGVNWKTFKEMSDLGFHGFTSGNHIWDNKEVLAIMAQEENLFRPANYPSSMGNECPGRGYGWVSNGKHELFVINLMGRVFMDSIDCPFLTVDKILRENNIRGPILVDMYADATSEMAAMGWYLDGRVTAVLGSHSHVQTADERVLPGGTAFITDVGMSGSWDSCIGLKPPEIIKRFITRRSQRYQTATENPGVCCVVIDVDGNRAKSIERIRLPVRVDVDGVD